MILDYVGGGEVGLKMIDGDERFNWSTIIDAVFLAVKVALDIGSSFTHTLTE